MRLFEDIVNAVLNEEVVAGGTGSAFGSGVTSTSGPFSGDTYAKGDARVPKVLGSKVITRNMPNDTIFTGKSKKRRRKTK